MKIALAQIDVVPGKPKRNLETMLKMVGEAKSQKIDLIAFPEMCIGGYLVSDKWQEDNFCHCLMEYNDVLREASSDIAIAYGNVFSDTLITHRVQDAGYHPNKDSRERKYNCVYIFQDGKPATRSSETKILPQGIEPKTLLPNYRIFDEERYFFSMQDIAKDFGVKLESLLQPFVLRVDGGHKVPIGFELCEDLWCEDYRRNGQALNPTKILIENGAELIINISASPWTFGKNESRDRKIQFLKKESGENFVPFLYINCVGVQNNGKNLVLFDGGTTVYNKDGLPIILGNHNFHEEFLIVEDSDFTSRKPLERREVDEIEQKYHGIVRGTQHINDLQGRIPNYVVGLSGGIDSAVVAALVAIAVGKERVTGVNMPTDYNKLETRDSAKYLAKKLGIKYLVIPIKDLVESNRRILKGLHTGEGEKLASILEQNIQPKVRMQILSNLAQQMNGIYTNNSNKWEISVGYSTLDGDSRGAFSPIGDLTKSEVIQMAQYLNQQIFKDEVIPKALINLQIPSGPELERGQKSPLKIGYHCALVKAYTDFRSKSAEDIMRWYLDGTIERNLGITSDIMKKNGIDKPSEFIRDLEWFDGQINKSIFKRIQGPPIILLSKTAYGYDRRESILPHQTSITFDRLKTQVLSMQSYKQAGQVN